MNETLPPHQEGIKNPSGNERMLTHSTDTVGINRIQELFKLTSGNDIVGKMSGTNYKYTFIPIDNGWSLSEEAMWEDGMVYYTTINMRNGKYELFKNSVKDGKGNPSKSSLSLEAAKGYIGDMIHKITLITAGRQTSSLEDRLAFA